jgi:ADP-ribose pyrophosphatase
VPGAFRRVEEEVRYRGPFLTVVGATFESPDGERFQREYLRHLSAVAVVALVDDGRAALLVRQFRAALDEQILEIPAGLLDVEGEDREAAVRRELEEEAGRVVTGELELLIDYIPTAGMSDQRVTIYLSRTSEPCEIRPHGPEEVHMSIEPVPLDEVPAYIAAGRIGDGKSIVGLLLARDRLA